MSLRTFFNAAAALYVGCILLPSGVLAQAPSSSVLPSGGGKALLEPSDTVCCLPKLNQWACPFPWFGFATAVVIELLGGAALAAGFAVRWAAGILAAFTMVAGLSFHSNFEDHNQLAHLLKNVAITGGLLLVVVLGDRRFVQYQGTAG